MSETGHNQDFPPPSAEPLPTASFLGESGRARGQIGPCKPLRILFWISMFGFQV